MDISHLSALRKAHEEKDAAEAEVAKLFKQYRSEYGHAHASADSVLESFPQDADFTAAIDRVIAELRFHLNEV